MNDNKPNFFGVTPAPVLFSEHLSDFAVRLFPVISTLCNSEGYCTANNGTLAKWLNCSSSKVSRAVSELSKHKFIDVEIEKNASGTWRKLYLCISRTEGLSSSAKGGTANLHNGLSKSAQGGIADLPIQKNSIKNNKINKNNSQSGTQSEIDSLKKELKQLKAKKQNNQYTPALTLVTAKKEIDRLYTTDSLHQLFCTSVKPVDKKIVKLAKESFILKYSFERYPIFNQDKLQTALFKWIANQRPEYKTKTQTQTESNKITASTQMTRQECIDANLENGFNF